MHFTTSFVACAVALGSFASASLGASGAELGHGAFLRPRHGSGSIPHSLSKRAASSTTTSTLSTIIEMIIPKCKATCSSMISDLSSCAGQSSETAIATCACSSTALGDIRTCAACIAEDTTSTKNATAVVNDYNSFVKLCIADGLATVTGTVAVGASTSAVKRTSTTSHAKATTTKSSTTKAASSATTASGSAAASGAGVKAAAASASGSEASSKAGATSQVGAKAAAVTVSSTSTVQPSATGSTTSPADKVGASWAMGLVGAGAAAWLAVLA